MLAPALPALRGSLKKRKKHDKTEEVDQLITGWALEARGGDPDAVERFIRALHRYVRATSPTSAPIRSRRTT